MTTHAEDCWRMACRKIEEARRLDPVETPEALITTSYYAMHHAARATLIANAGSAPKTHDAVISGFGLLVKNGDGRMKAAGRAINAAFDTRCSANYDTRYDVDAETARETYEAAEAFLALCRELIGPAPACPSTDIP